MLTFPFAARRQKLTAYVRTTDTVHLFANDIHPNAQTAAADFVEPPAELGYRPIQLGPAAWRIESIGAAVRAICAPAAWTFTDGKVVCYGHYVLDKAGELLWAERFGEMDGDIWRDLPFEALRPKDKLELVIVLDHEDAQ